MEVKAEKKIYFNQDPTLIWTKIIDPSFMVKSVPGAELTEQTDDTHFKGIINIKIGPVTAKFNGEAEFTKLKESEKELTMEGRGLDTSGKGGANMVMNIKLVPIEGGGTEMLSSMTLSITGRLAQFGSRMIVAVNNKMFDQWEKIFSDLLNEKVNADEVSKNLKNQQNALESSDSQPVKAIPIIWAAVKGIFKNKG